MTVPGISLEFILLFGLLTSQASSLTGADIHPSGIILDEGSRNTDKQQYLSKHWAYIINSVPPSVPSFTNNTLVKTNSLLVEKGTKFGLFLRKFAELELGLQETKVSIIIIEMPRTCFYRLCLYPDRLHTNQFHLTQSKQ